MRECDHLYIPTKYTKSNGVVCVREQCTTCWESGQERKKADYDIERLPWFDHDRQAAHRATQQLYRDAEREQARQDWKQEQFIQSQEWWDTYNQYLRSPTWAALRRKVLHRDKFLCQNCFRKVTDSTANIHHLTYYGYNRGETFAFECETLCKECHDRYHSLT